MKILFKPLAACVLVALAGSAAAQTATAPSAATSASAPTGRVTATKDQISYATGVMAIRNFTKNDVAFDIEIMIQGMRDALAGKEMKMSDREMTMVMNRLKDELRRTMATNQRELADKNRKRGTEFLASYKAKPDVKTLGNGVAYRVLKAGDGPKPVESDMVVTRYRGTTIDGVEFDATMEGKTSTLRMNQVIMGWREALKQMPVGSKWEIVVPAPLAYGDRGVGDLIGPNEVLVFDVELLEIKK
jgi:FKBP-type peptidyl-prolyl cis-trans isomerase FklB